MNKPAPFSPALAPVAAGGDAPALGGTRAANATGQATDLRAWVFAGRKEYSTGNSYRVDRVACALDEVPAAEWAQARARRLGALAHDLALTSATTAERPGPRAVSPTLAERAEEAAGELLVAVLTLTAEDLGLAPAPGGDSPSLGGPLVA